MLRLRLLYIMVSGSMALLALFFIVLGAGLYIVAVVLATWVIACIVFLFRMTKLLSKDASLGNVGFLLACLVVLSSPGLALAFRLGFTTLPEYVSSFVQHLPDWGQWALLFAYVLSAVTTWLSLQDEYANFWSAIGEALLRICIWLFVLVGAPLIWVSLDKGYAHEVVSWLNERFTPAPLEPSCTGGFAPGHTLRLYAPRIDRVGQRVVINGVDAARPRTPFTFDWGDGTRSTGFFPQTKTYRRAGIYNIHVLSTYSNGCHDNAIMGVNLQDGLYSPIGIQ